MMAGRCHNCIRFVFSEEEAVPMSEVFGQMVLFGILGFKAEDLYCLICLARGFDVPFQSAEKLAKF